MCKLWHRKEENRPRTLECIIGERELANLVVQLARFFYIYIYVYIYLCLSGRCTYRNVLRTSKYALVGGGPVAIP